MPLKHNGLCFHGNFADIPAIVQKLFLAGQKGMIQLRAGDLFDLGESELDGIGVLRCISRAGHICSSFSPLSVFPPPNAVMFMRFGKKIFGFASSTNLFL